MLEKRQVARQIGARPAEVGQRFFCERALAATLFVRADVRPSLRSLDAFDATLLLVTRLVALAMFSTSFCARVG